MNREKQKILDLFAEGDTVALAGHIRGGLHRARDQTLASIQGFITAVDGKVRLKLLEILMEDGGPDLISLFIHCIREERNPLFAKSQILLYREFQHQEALAALLSIEGEIDPDLRATYQRALGRLLSRFSQHFYMSELTAGKGNPRRLEFAVDMMLRHPHPDYLPFLNERIQDSDAATRVESVRALETFGDDSSLEPMFALLTRSRTQQSAVCHFLETIGAGGGPEALLHGLARFGGVRWDQDQCENAIARIKTGDVKAVLSDLMTGYDLEPEILKKVKPYLEEILSGQEVSAFEDSRIHTTLEEYREQIEKLMGNAARTLGVVAARVGEESFPRVFDHFLPGDDPRRDHLLINAMAGFRDDAGYEMLVEYVNTCDQPDLLEHALQALHGYQPRRAVPPGITKLCYDEKNSGLRRKALSLLAHWGEGTDTINELLDHKSISVRADAVRVAAEYGLEGCYNKILQLIRPGVPDSLLVAALEALRYFDQPQTGMVVKPLLLPPNTLTVRRAALETLYVAGGEERFQQIHQVFARNQRMSDLVESFISQILDRDFEQAQSAILHNRDFWLAIIEKGEESPRRKTITIIERLDLQQERFASNWLSGLERLVVQFSGDSEWEVTLKTIAVGLKSWLTAREESDSRDKVFREISEGLNAKNPYQRIQSLRKLNQSYQPEMVTDSTVNLRKLLTSLGFILEDDESGQEMMLQAIAAAGTVRHPRLRDRLLRFHDHPSAAIREAATSALARKPDRAFIHPIQSIFIMDDSRYITKQLTKVLAREGFDVDYENEVAPGMKQLKEKRYDLLVLDLVMPGMSGIEFLQRARHLEIEPSHTLVVTSTRNQEELDPLLSAGVKGILLKPFRMDEMLERIKEISREPVG